MSLIADVNAVCVLTVYPLGEGGLLLHFVSLPNFLLMNWKSGTCE